jgi:hypothetical protein
MIQKYKYNRPKGKTSSGNSSGSGSSFYSASSSETTTIIKELDKHYIFGQPFDGTQDVKGDLVAENIKATSLNIHKDYDADENLVENSGNAVIEGQLTVDEIIANNLKGGSADVVSMVVDYLTVNKGATFSELTLNQIESMGGSIILSPAGGFTVEKLVNDDTGYKLYWAKQEAQSLLWQIGDYARCQSFDTGKYFWWKVDNVGFEDDYWFIVLNPESTLGEGVLNPEIGDVIVQLGSEIEDRGSAIYIASNNSIDADLTAPLVAQYKGINANNSALFDLRSCKTTYFAANGNKIQGDLVATSGKSVDEVVNSFSELKLTAEGLSSFASNLMQDNLLYYGDESVDKLSDWSFFATHNKLKSEYSQKLCIYRWAQKGMSTYTDAELKFNQERLTKGKYRLTFNFEVFDSGYAHPETCVFDLKYYILNKTSGEYYLNVNTRYPQKSNLEIFPLDGVTFDFDLTETSDVEIYFYWRNLAGVSLTHSAYYDVRLENLKLYSIIGATSSITQKADSIELKVSNLYKENLMGSDYPWIGGTRLTTTYSYIGDWNKDANGPRFMFQANGFLGGVSLPTYSPMYLPKGTYTLSFEAEGVVVIGNKLQPNPYELCAFGFYYETYHDNDGQSTTSISGLGGLCDQVMLDIDADGVWEVPIEVHEGGVWIVPSIRMGTITGSTGHTQYLTLKNFKLIADSASTSLIKQTAEEIMLAVDEVALKVNNKGVVIDGNTVVNGSLTLNDDTQGFVLNGATGSTYIQPKSIGTYNSFSTAASNALKLSTDFAIMMYKYDTDGSVVTYKGAALFSNNLGTIPAGTTLSLNNFVCQWSNEATTRAILLYPDAEVESIVFNLMQGVNRVETFTTTDSSFEDTLFNYTVEEDAEFSVQVIVNLIAKATASTVTGVTQWQVTGALSYNVVTPNPAFMLIGYDGIGVNFGDNRTVFFGAEGSTLNYGSNALRIDNNGVYRKVGTKYIDINKDSIVTIDSATSITYDPLYQSYIVTVSTGSTTIKLPVGDDYAGCRVNIIKAGNGTITATTGNFAYIINKTTASSAVVSMSLEMGNNTFICDGNYWYNLN